MTNGVICDLEDLLAQKLEAKGLAGIVGAAFLFGSGGNTNLLVGGDTSFKYYGHDLVINRGRHQLYFKSDDDTVIPLLVMVLGLAGLLAAALVLRFVYKAQMKGACDRVGLVDHTHGRDTLPSAVEIDRVRVGA